MAPSIMYMKDGRKLWEKFFMDMRIDQLKEEDYFMDLKGNKYFPGAGLIPSQAPCIYIMFFQYLEWGAFLTLFRGGVQES